MPEDGGFYVIAGPAVESAAAVEPRENLFGHAKKLRLIRESLDRLRAERGGPLEILDVGCGNGSAVTRFLPRAGDRVLGIDEHGPSIAFAAASFSSAELEFRTRSAESLAEEGRRFDAVVFADVLEHLERPQTVLAAGARLLRESGRALVTVPNGYGPFEIESWLSRLPGLGKLTLRGVDYFVAALNRFVFPEAWTRFVGDPDAVPYNVHSGHVQFYTRARMRSMARPCGLEPVAEKPLSWLAGPYTNYLFAPSSSFCAWNARAADALPLWMASAWFFEFRRRAEAVAP